MQRPVLYSYCPDRVRINDKINKSILITMKMNMKNLVGISELNDSEIKEINGGHGGPPPGGIAYRSHDLADFFRGVLDGLSSLWK